MNASCTVGCKETAATLLPDNADTQKHPMGHKNPEPLTLDLSGVLDKTPGARRQLMENRGGYHGVWGSILEKPEETCFSVDREFDFLQVPTIPRSSSLKSTKSLPGTPTRRKSVRFADALGLDLALVRHILNPDEPPLVDTSSSCPLPETSRRPSLVSYWRVCFRQPLTAENITDRVRTQKVLLENCVVSNSNGKVYGTVRVANVTYQKEVKVRYTSNRWISYDDIPATYIENSSDLITDRFAFAIAIPGHLVPRSRMEFAVMFFTGDQTFWDNNCARNYALECVEYDAP